MATLPLYGAAVSPGTRIRRCMAVAGTLPVTSASWVRWALRSRARFAALGVLSYVVYEALEHVGVFSRVTAGYQSI